MTTGKSLVSCALLWVSTCATLYERTRSALLSAVADIEAVFARGYGGEPRIRLGDRAASRRIRSQVGGKSARCVRGRLPCRARFAAAGIALDGSQGIRDAVKKHPRPPWAPTAPDQDRARRILERRARGSGFVTSEDCQPGNRPALRCNQTERLRWRTTSPQSRSFGKQSDRLGERGAPS